MLKKAKNRSPISGRNRLILHMRRRGHFYPVVVSRRIISNLLTRAVQNRDCVFAGTYRTATVRESVADGLFQQPVKAQAALTFLKEIRDRSANFSFA